MPKIRRILKPAREGTNVTLAQARAIFRDIKREREDPKKPAARPTRRSAKAG